MEFKVSDVAQLIQGTVDGDPNVLLHDVSKIEEGKPGTLTFYSNPKYEHYVYSTEASAVIVNADFQPTQPVKATLIRVPDSRQALAQLLYIYESMVPQKVGIEQPSFISSTATVGDKIYVGAFAYIGEKVQIGNNVKIYPQAYIGDGVKIGNDCQIFPGVKIYKGCVLGDRVIVHAGTVIGADGFGFQPDANNNYKKVPQIGNVVIEDDVEIGANTCIDRATMGSTRIGKGTKLDNLIQIAHNVEIGQNNVMAAQSGIAGSTKVGSNCMIGGQVGIAGHINVPDQVVLAAQTGVNSTIKKSGTYFGSPAMDYMAFNKSFVMFRKLPEIKAQLDELAEKVGK